MKPTDNTSAVIYARYSSSSQTEQSIEGQLHDGYEFAKRNGYIVIREYIDRAKTGTSDSRPSFQQMIRDSEKGLFSTVIVWKQDRFARNRYDSAVYKRILKNNGVRVVSVMENITDSPEGVILEGLLEAMAEYYSANLSENIKRGRAESVRKGIFPGGPVPLGYKVENKRLVPDPKTAPIVKEIFRRYADGDRMKDIFTDLNARGLRAKRNAPFQYATISHILHNRTYSGDYYYGEQMVPSAVDPLIDRETFNRVSARIEQNHRAPAANRYPDHRSLLLHKLFCGECGNRMTGARGVSKKTYFYYQCHGRVREHTNCGMKSVCKDDLHYAVCRVVSDFVLNKKRGTLETLADSIMEIYRSEIDTSQMKSIESQLAQVDRDLDKLVDSLITMPESARPRIAQRMEDLELQKKDLEARLVRKKAEQNSYFSKEDFVKFLQITFDDLENMDNQKFIIDKFVNSVYLYNDGRMVVYLNHIRGLPYPSDDAPPGKDSYKSGKNLPLPAEIAMAEPFSFGSSLYTYAPVYVNKHEQTPLLFFLHGMIGIMLWRHVIPNEIVRDHGKIIKQVKPRI